MLTTTQAAAELGISSARMRLLIKSGRVKSRPNPYGKGSVVEMADLKAVRNRPTGRPRKKAVGQ